jgi:y4mF family transcriptional regulator
MRMRTATDLGAFIRERRTKLGMDQVALAEKAGTSRKWLIEVEQGKPRAEIGLILRTLKTLGVSIDLQIDSLANATSNERRRSLSRHQQRPEFLEETPMTNQLIALLDGREVGTVTHKSGRLSFTYSESWIRNPNAYPTVAFDAAWFDYARTQTD